MRSGMQRRVQGGGSRRLVPLNTPSAIQVRCSAHETPFRVYLDRRAHTVDTIQESWRIDDEWWRTPIRRVYHRIVLDDGRIVTVYRDLETERWYLQR